MLVWRLATVTSFQSGDFLRVASTMLALVPFLMTGSICLKSPHSMTGMPPNLSGCSVMSCKVLSMASYAALWVMCASSMIIARHWRMIVARVVPFLIAHVGLSLKCMSSGILNVECSVRPPRNRVAAIPLEAVASAI